MLEAISLFRSMCHSLNRRHKNTYLCIIKAMKVSFIFALNLVVIFNSKLLLLPHDGISALTLGLDESYWQL